MQKGQEKGALSKFCIGAYEMEQPSSLTEALYIDE